MPRHYKKSKRRKSSAVIEGGQIWEHIEVTGTPTSIVVHSRDRVVVTEQAYLPWSSSSMIEIPYIILCPLDGGEPQLVSESVFRHDYRFTGQYIQEGEADAEESED